MHAVYQCTFSMSVCDVTPAAICRYLCQYECWSVCSVAVCVIDGSQRPQGTHNNERIVFRKPSIHCCCSYLCHSDYKHHNVDAIGDRQLGILNNGFRVSDCLSLLISLLHTVMETTRWPFLTDWYIISECPSALSLLLSAGCYMIPV